MVYLYLQNQRLRRRVKSDSEREKLGGLVGAEIEAGSVLQAVCSPHRLHRSIDCSPMTPSPPHVRVQHLMLKRRYYLFIYAQLQLRLTF